MESLRNAGSEDSDPHTIQAVMLSHQVLRDLGWWLSWGAGQKIDQLLSDTELRKIAEFHPESSERWVEALDAWLGDECQIEFPYLRIGHELWPQADGFRLGCHTKHEVIACLSKSTAGSFFRDVDELVLTRDVLNHAYSQYGPSKGDEGTTMLAFMEFLRTCCRKLESEDDYLLVFRVRMEESNGDASSFRKPPD